MLKVTLPTPPSANTLFPTGKNNRRFKSKRYREWIQLADNWLQSQGVKCEEMTGRLRAEYKFSFPDKRKRDIANFEKAITDFLNECRYFKDDSQIDIMHLVRIEEGQGCVFVEIKEIPRGSIVDIET